MLRLTYAQQSLQGSKDSTVRHSNSFKGSNTATGFGKFKVEDGSFGRNVDILNSRSQQLTCT